MKQIPFPVVILLAVVWLPTPAARAELCTIDAVPAATLLLPYFEVDLSRFPRLKKVEETVISLQNASAAPALAHVTLWTDLSVPTLAFDVYLTGYDVEEINLAELFYTGEIKGLKTAESTSGFVLGETPAGGIQTVQKLIQAHRGQPVDGQCYSTVPDLNVARGYVTIDNVNASSTLFPSDPGYFGMDGIASSKNVLWGAVFVANSKAVRSDLLVHVEAGSSMPGDYTFYGRYVGFNGSDGREPLGTTWGARYSTGSRNRTDVIVWRDSTAVQRPFSCDALGESGWYPLGQTQVVAFNDSSDPIELLFDSETGEPVPGFPAETQKVKVGSGDLKVAPFKSGWIYFNLLHTSTGLGQSYVWVRQGLGKRMAAYPGMPFYDANSGSPSAASACGPAPSAAKAAIP